MRGPSNSHSTDMVGSIHTDNSRIRNPDSQFRQKSERQNAAPERKPIHLPPMQLREAFSYIFPFLVCCFARNGKLLLRISPTRLRIHASLYNIIGCGRSRGCQKSLKNAGGGSQFSPFFEIALLLVRLDHRNHCMANPDRRRIVENFGTLRIPPACKSWPQSEGRIISSSAQARAIRGYRANALR
jgi:hypothetical protein